MLHHANVIRQQLPFSTTFFDHPFLGRSHSLYHTMAAPVGPPRYFKAVDPLAPKPDPLRDEMKRCVRSFAAHVSSNFGDCMPPRLAKALADGDAAAVADVSANMYLWC